MRRIYSSCKCLTILVLWENGLIQNAKGLQILYFGKETVESLLVAVPFCPNSRKNMSEKSFLLTKSTSPPLTLATSLNVIG